MGTCSDVTKNNGRKVNTLKAYKNSLYTMQTTVWHRVTCGNCKEELIVSDADVERIPFKPENKTSTAFLCGDYNKSSVVSEKDAEPKEITSTIPMSSDGEQDTVKFKCCNCGYLCAYTGKQYDESKCDWNAENNSREFRLSEKQIKQANTFFNEHVKHCDVLTQYKIPFQYVFTPNDTTGHCYVTVRCFKCGACKDISSN